MLTVNTATNNAYLFVCTTKPVYLTYVQFPGLNFDDHKPSFDHRLSQERRQLMCRAS